MLRRYARRALILLGILAFPLVVGWSLLNAGAAIGLIIFAALLWITTLPLQSDMRAARAQRAAIAGAVAAAAPRLDIADTAVDAAFARLIADGGLADGPSRRDDA